MDFDASVIRRLRGIRVLLTALAVAAALGMVGCGGDDEDPEPPNPTPDVSSGDSADQAAAESTVKAYLKAYAQRDGEAACAELTDEWQKAMVESTHQHQGEETCEELVAHVARDHEVQFEREPYTAGSVDKMKFQTKVDDNEGGKVATVYGERGLMWFSVVETGGGWEIEEIHGGA